MLSPPSNGMLKLNVTSITPSLAEDGMNEEHTGADGGPADFAKEHVIIKMGKAWYYPSHD